MVLEKIFIAMKLVFFGGKIDSTKCFIGRDDVFECNSMLLDTIILVVHLTVEDVTYAAMSSQCIDQDK